MAYFIDGNNLIGALKKEKVGKPEARYWLVYYIKEFQKKRRSKVVLFFDGPIDYDLMGESNNIEIIFSVEREADILIKERINKLKYRKDLFVVTADNDLIYYAKRKGAKIIPPRKFFKYVLKYFDKGREKPAKKLTKVEIKIWEDIFRKRQK